MNLFTKLGKDDVTSMRIWHSRESPLLVIFIVAPLLGGALAAGVWKCLGK